MSEKVVAPYGKLSKSCPFPYNIDLIYYVLFSQQSRGQMEGVCAVSVGCVVCVSPATLSQYLSAQIFFLAPAARF